MRYCFVILHYMAHGVTRCCLDAISRVLPGEDSPIVIVDNGSPDGSGAMLQMEYVGNPRISFVMLKENLGFARGNNEGYKFARDHFDPDFIICMNNDILVSDPAFLDKIAAEYAADPFAVLGPDIFVPLRDWHQNPARLQPMTMEEAEAIRKKYARKNRHFFYNYLTWNLKLALWMERYPEPEDHDSAHPHDGCVLHGACYIFSRDFISARQLAFNPATFLYFEEDILQLECSRAGLKMRYSPALQVTHLEDSSTRAAYGSVYKRTRMKSRRMVESLNVFIQELGGE